MSEKNQASQGGVGVMGLLLVLFVGLKLTGPIDWSWWWVTAPIWAPLAAVLAIVVVILIFTILQTLYQTLRGR